MSVTQKLVTTNFNVESAASFVDSFANNDYFIFAGKHTPYPGSDANLTTPDNSLKSTNLDVYDNMIFAKRVTSSDVIHSIAKHLWTSNTFFYKYDHTDGSLYDKNFYTVVCLNLDRFQKSYGVHAQCPIPSKLILRFSGVR